MKYYLTPYKITFINKNECPSFYGLELYKEGERIASIGLFHEIKHEHIEEILKLAGIKNKIDLEVIAELSPTHQNKEMKEWKRGKVLIEGIKYEQLNDYRVNKVRGFVKDIINP